MERIRIVPEPENSLFADYSLFACSGPGSNVRCLQCAPDASEAKGVLEGVQFRRPERAGAAFGQALQVQGP